MPINNKNQLREPLWERQHKEPDKSFGYFLVYRDLPYGVTDPNTGLELLPRQRTLTEAAEVCGRTRSLIQKASSDWQWKERVHAYDIYRDQIELEERKKRRIEAARKMEERSIAYRDDAHLMFEKLKRNFHEMMEGPIYEEKEQALIGEDGQPTGETETIRVAVNWNWNTAAKIADSLTRLATFAAGSDEAGMLDRLLERIDVAQLSPDQRRRIINGESPVQVIFGGGGIARQGKDSGIREQADAS